MQIGYLLLGIFFIAIGVISAKWTVPVARTETRITRLIFGSLVDRPLNTRARAIQSRLRPVMFTVAGLVLVVLAAFGGAH